MNKIIISFVVVALVLVGGYFLFKGSYSTPSIPQTSNQQTTPPSPTSQASVVTPMTYNVLIQNFAFSQKFINVKRGDTVVWTNKDSAPHTVTGGNSGPASNTLNVGGTYNFTFNTAGTFDYHCAFHPSMTGSIVVTQ
ncbi:MAG: Blue (Type 1) copper domain protein [Parcubacteria group bacterium GW2011_GWB1_36_5]|nr:MAG: Blue (Type 1) copper domain protein [Parcubacteria group bacterium GW2011_GWA2_36_24]KKQ07930.1 MAG: Blue (Type 1) copper domain protein [Parcubacteria group bacterium GW2011_GWB1_36_5]